MDIFIFMRLLYLLFSLFLTLSSFPSHALNFSSTFLVINCPERDNVEVLLHVYGHTEEKWNNNFEVGAGHKTLGKLEFIPFANGDILIHDRLSDTFSYVYYGVGPVQRCKKLSEKTLFPTF